MNYIDDIQQKLNPYQLGLPNQSQSCPIITLPCDQIDHCPKEMIDRERNYLKTRNNRQLLQLKDTVHEKELVGIISTYSLGVNLISVYHF